MKDEFLQQLHDYIVISHHRLAEYKTLFMWWELQWQMLHETAGLFFEQLYQMYWDYFFIDISRLTDKGEDYKWNKSLTLDYLRNYFEQHKEKIFSESQISISDYFWIAKEISESFKTIRNKVVAHRDLERISIEDKFKDINIDQVEKFYKTIENIFNELSGELEDRSEQFTPLCSDWAWLLLYRLQDAMIYKQLKEDRLDKDVLKDTDSFWKLEQKEKDRCKYGNLEFKNYQ